MASIERTENVRPLNEQTEVRVKRTGATTEVRYMATPQPPDILKLSAHEYLELNTGEVREFQHTENRADNISCVAQTLSRLRDVINTNVTDAKKVLWVTLTYRENMTDTERLYEDYRKFWQKFKRKYPPCEYITAADCTSIR